MSRRGGNASTFGFIDVLLVLNIVLMALVLLVVPSINPKVDQTATVTPPGNLMVSINWPQGADDVDLLLMAPGEKKAVSYQHRGGKIWNLVRDDRGIINDETPFNHEEGYSRGLPDGEYVVNVNCFACHSAEVPVTLEVKLADLHGSISSVFQATVDLRPFQQRTAVRFTARGGGIVPGSINQVLKPLQYEE